MVIKKINNIKHNRKAQMKIQQMAFLLMAVFILFVMIGIVVISVKTANLKKTATVLNEQEALTLLSKLANSPEFSCGNSYGNQKSDCIDFDKIMALKKNIKNYKELWGVSNIEIRKLPNKNIICTDANYPGCDTLKIINDSVSGYSAANFVSVCYKESVSGSVMNKCDFGEIIVSYEVVQ